MTTSIIIMALIAFIGSLLTKLSERCFDDEDPDCNWNDNYSKPSKPINKCLHEDKTDVVQVANVTCEEVWTICDDCSEVINKRIDC